MIQKEKYDVAEKLYHVRNLSTKYTPQHRMSYLSFERKVEYLYNSVLALQWSKQSLKQCYENFSSCNFQKLYMTPDTAWL